MNKNTRIILLSIISVLIIIVIVLGVTSAFMRPVVEESSITSVNLQSCAHITLTDTGDSINLSNSYPMTKNRALQTTPYTFTVTSTCENPSGFNLYLVTLNTNSLDASNIHYIITNYGDKTILEEGILSEATNGVSDFEDYEINQINNGINGTYGSIYILYNGQLSNEKISFDLYLYIDEAVANETMNQAFTAGVLVKAGEYTPPTSLAQVCNDGDNLATCITDFYNVSGTEITGIYYHTSSLANGAGDNSYRYAGANPNNYVCFGSDATTCPNDNLYRIIGVFGNQVKLIMADYPTTSQTGTGGAYYDTYSVVGYDTSDYKGNQSTSQIGVYYWNPSGTNTWSSSSLTTTNLNDIFLDSFSSTWRNKIAAATWYVNGYDTQFATPVEFQDAESTGTPWTGKIGLMYVSDYGFASTPSAWTTNMIYYHSTSIRNNNWMYMGLSEWTISRTSSSSDTAWVVSDSGSVSGYLVDWNNLAVRPSFYLTSSTTYVSGSGTSADPFRIN